MNALQLLINKYENEIDMAKFNVDNLINNPVGVAEHPDLLETIETELRKIAEASDLLEAALIARSDTFTVEQVEENLL